MNSTLKRVEVGATSFTAWSCRLIVFLAVPSNGSMGLQQRPSKQTRVTGAVLAVPSNGSMGLQLYTYDYTDIIDVILQYPQTGRWDCN